MFYIKNFLLLASSFLLLTMFATPQRAEANPITEADGITATPPATATDADADADGGKKDPPITCGENSNAVTETQIKETFTTEELEGLKTKIATTLNRIANDDSDNETKKNKRSPCDALLNDILNKKINSATACEAKLTEIEEAKKEYTQACANFTIGAQTTQCFVAVNACLMCPEDTDSEYNCVNVHNKSRCPVLSGDELKDAKEKRTKFLETQKELKDTIEDKTTDLLEKEQDLNQELSDLENNFTEAITSLEKATANQKNDLETQLQTQKAKISQVVATAMAEAQKQINASLEIAHKFENALTTTHMNYRKERRTIRMECEIQAQGRLASYQKKRRMAIQTGSYQTAVATLLKKGRTNFATKDKSLLNKYYTKCLNKRKPDFKEAKTIYKQKLRQIEQKKEEYQKNIKISQQKIANLHNLASKDQNTLVQNYAKNMDKILKQHHKNYQTVIQNYNKSKQSLMSKTKGIFVAKQQLAKSTRQYEADKIALFREQELIHFLKNKGVKDNEGNEKETEYGTVVNGVLDYHNSLDIAKSTCKCPEEVTKDIQESSSCQYIGERADELKTKYEYLLEESDEKTGQP